MAVLPCHVLKAAAEIFPVTPPRPNRTGLLFKQGRHSPTSKFHLSTGNRSASQPSQDGGSGLCILWGHPLNQCQAHPVTHCPAPPHLRQLSSGLGPTLCQHRQP
jgi:hypothetical protein